MIVADKPMDPDSNKTIVPASLDLVHMTDETHWNAGE